MASCASETANSNEEYATEVENIDSAQGEDNIYYGIPSPEEMFVLMRRNEKFDPSLQFPIQDVEGYTTSKEQSIIFGIYLSDLAYGAVYEDFEQSMKYFKVIEKLADKLNLTAAFNEALASRIQNNLKTPDSLLLISNDSYRSIIKCLEENDRGNTIALVASAGWIESMYIATNLISTIKDNQEQLNQIAEQKFLYENLMGYLGQYDDFAIKSVKEDLVELGTLFNSLEQKEKERSSKKVGGKLMLSGGTYYVMTPEQFVNLKGIIAKIRGNMTGASI